ncbi:InlB B-repeat-containing protein [Metallosphaera hakonensis]|uniref:Bacterial repeat domain-containing protein n=1 Tax=Metallosphaera hakonensis JCM 8857 = DSM 7519 TaxID=1293036 RepID=A0A2U9IRY8_9CREN|nr:hypothetical protein [Metallosphaera hakonensis]AWR98758.1 hypothetical protein DFR87_02595 [Metallosphaera hakonensis JCM 8857 = DSM 7519]
MRKSTLVLLSLLLSISSSSIIHGVTLHVFIYGYQTQVLLYENGTFLFANSNATFNVPNSTVQVYVNSLSPSSEILINGIKTSNLTINPARTTVLNVTVKPLYYHVEVNVEGPGSVYVIFPNESRIKVNGTEGFNVQAGTVLTLTASPDQGYSIMNWSDGLVGNQIWYMVYNDSNLTAYFVKSPETNHFGPGVSYAGIGLLALLGGMYWFARKKQ